MVRLLLKAHVLRSVSNISEPFAYRWNHGCSSIVENQPVLIPTIELISFGTSYSFKRKRVAESDEEERVSVYYTEKGRIEEVHPIPKQSPAKRQAMDADYGRPTQVHGVPPEERAYDSKGNRLPWGLEWHE